MILKFKNYSGKETVVGTYETKEQLNKAVVEWLKMHNISPKGKNGYITREFEHEDGRTYIDYGSWASYLIIEEETTQLTEEKEE